MPSQMTRIAQQTYTSRRVRLGGFIVCGITSHNPVLSFLFRPHRPSIDQRRGRIMEADDDDFDRVETEEQKPTRRLRPGFAHALAACGLSTEEAMSYLDLSRSAVEKKSAGSRSMSAEDGRRLSALWHRIRTGDAAGLPDGPFGMAVTMLVLSGKHVPQQVKLGRRPRSHGENVEVVS